MPIDWKYALASGLANVGGSTVEELKEKNRRGTLMQQQIEENERKRRQDDLTSALSTLSLTQPVPGQSLDLSSLSMPQIEALKSQGVIRGRPDLVSASPVPTYGDYVSDSPAVPARFTTKAVSQFGYEINPQGIAPKLIEQAKLKEAMGREELKAATAKASGMTTDAKQKETIWAAMEDYVGAGQRGDTNAQRKAGLRLADYGIDPTETRDRMNLRSALNPLIIEVARTAPPGSVAAMSVANGSASISLRDDLTASGSGSERFGAVSAHFHDQIQDVTKDATSILMNPKGGSPEEKERKIQALTSGVPARMLSYFAQVRTQAPELWESMFPLEAKLAAGVTTNDSDAVVLRKLTDFAYAEFLDNIRKGQEPTEGGFISGLLAWSAKAMGWKPTGKVPATPKDADVMRESIFK